MRIDVFTLFPAMIDGFCSESLLGKARGGGLLDLRLHDPREQTADVHRTVDDAPFGGGAGMLMTPKPLFDSVEAELARMTGRLEYMGERPDLAAVNKLLGNAMLIGLWAVMADVRQAMLAQPGFGEPIGHTQPG